MADLPRANPQPPLTANGDYDIVASSALTDFIISGNFGGATVTCSEICPVSGNAVPFDNGAYLSPKTGVFETEEGRTLRFTISGATGATAINIYVGMIRHG